jgi:ceramide glucosyltransferase
LALRIFLVLAVLLLIQSVASLRDGYRFLRFVRSSRRRPPGAFTPSAAVIIPLKGVDEGLDANLAEYLTQDYPRYQLIFVVAEEVDPAHAFLAARLAAPPEGAARVPAALVVAGHSQDCGEKVHNLLRGLESVQVGTEVLVFADADARPPRHWLRSLVAPLEDASVTVSTGFRWYLPGASFASQLRAAWDASIATLLGEHKDNFAWGGSMAIRAADFRRLEVAERYWKGTVSDDYALTRAVREAGGRIRFEPRCLLASREESSFGEFLDWANRQIIITRVYAARLWRLGLAAHLLYCGTLLFGLLLLADAAPPVRAGVAAYVAVILLLGAAKGRIRTVVAREIFPEERRALERYGARYWQLTLLVPWVMLWNFLVAGFRRRIEWRRTSYELIAHDHMRILGRRGP